MERFTRKTPRSPRYSPWSAQNFSGKLSGLLTVCDDDLPIYHKTIIIFDFKPQSPKKRK
jgi:hypothetical protein